MSKEKKDFQQVYCQPMAAKQEGCDDEYYVVVRTEDGNVEQFKGVESDREVFKSQRDIKRNDVRRLRLAAAIAYETERPPVPKT